MIDPDNPFMGSMAERAALIAKNSPQQWGPGPSEHDRQAMTAKQVREALLALSDDATAFKTLAQEASDLALCRLRLMLR